MLTHSHLKGIMAVQSQVKDLVDLVLEKGERNRTKILESVSSSLSAIQHFNSDETLPTKTRPIIQARKTLRVLSNTLEGIETGLQDRELDLADLRQILVSKVNLVTLSSCTETVSNALSEIEETREEDRMDSLSSTERNLRKALADWAAGQKHAKTGSEHDEVKKLAKQKEDEEARTARDIKQLQKYAKLQSTIPSKLGNKEFDLLVLPIIPVFKDISLMTSSTLEKFKIKHHKIHDSFNVFDQQYVLVFSTKKADSFVNDKKTERKEKMKQGKTAGAENKRRKVLTAYVDHILDLINERSTVQYAMFTNLFVANPKNPDLMFAWIFPKNKLEKIRSSVRSMETTMWGFPWSLTSFDEE